MLDHHNLIEEILARFETGCSCSQAVFAGLAPRCGLAADTAARIASAFGGGIARQGQICGALSGALMALGLRYGHGCPPGGPEEKQRTLGLAQELIGRFRASQGDITCPGLLGYDLGDDGQRLAAEAAGVSKMICPGAVRAAAAAWLALEEELDAAQSG